jgi:hypothetical protein
VEIFVCKNSYPCFHCLLHFFSCLNGKLHFLACSTDTYTKLDGSEVCGILLGGKMSFESAQQSCKNIKADILEFQNEEEKEEFVFNKVIKNGTSFFNKLGSKFLN